MGIRNNQAVSEVGHPAKGWFSGSGHSNIVILHECVC
jgi:hypothetical protein